MLRSPLVRRTALALLAAAFVAAPIKIVFATAPQEAQPKPDEKTYTAEQRFERRYPQAVRVRDLVGLPVLDDRDSTYGYIRAVIRGSDGKFHLVVPYRGWFGWAPTDWGRKTVAVPVEAVAILARQVIALDFTRDHFVTAPEYAGADAQLGADETIRMAVYRR
ncbi:MAG TPA: PRC-barrel domain-containing protein [Xanthobacteraceae bacterium]|nr:PRC-barrel domain-containing protein [Xanthobacteraceae bacterium]